MKNWKMLAPIAAFIAVIAAVVWFIGGSSSN
jgi:hypothetical protein